MTEAKRLLKIIEADASDFDRNIGKALGVKMPDEWAAETNLPDDGDEFDSQELVKMVVDKVNQLLSQDGHVVMWPNVDQITQMIKENGYHVVLNGHDPIYLIAARAWEMYWHRLNREGRV